MLSKNYLKYEIQTFYAIKLYLPIYAYSKWNRTYRFNGYQGRCTYLLPYVCLYIYINLFTTSIRSIINLGCLKVNQQVYQIPFYSILLQCILWQGARLRHAKYVNIASSALHTPHTNLDHRRRFVVVVVVLFELKQLLQIQQLIAFIFRLKVWLSDGFNVGRLATTVVFVVAVVPFRSDQFSSVFSCGQSNVHSSSRKVLP